MFRKYVIVFSAVILTVAVVLSAAVYFASLNDGFQTIRTETENRTRALEENFYWSIRNYDLFGLNNLLNIVKSGAVRSVEVSFTRGGRPEKVAIGVIPLERHGEHGSCYSQSMRHIGEEFATLTYCVSRGAIRSDVFRNRLSYVLLVPAVLLALFLATHVPSVVYGLRLKKLLKLLSASPGEVSLETLKMTISRTQDRVLRDICENFMRLIEAEQMAKEAMAKQARFAAMGQVSAQIAHDMRSPLAVLKGYVELNDGGADAEVLELQMAAKRSVRKLLHMAHDLVDYSRATTVERSVINVGRFVRESVAMCSCDGIDGKRASVDYGRCTDVYVEVDAQKMGRVVMNVVNNALQALKDGEGDVRVVARVVNGGDLCVKISDTGRGIEAVNLPHIFDAFFTAGKKGGTGLGLAYCKHVAEAHGGTIDVESELGKGTTFTIRIPNCVVKAEGKVKVEDKVKKMLDLPVPITFSGRRFVVVDDDAEIRRHWRAMIETRGGRVAAEHGSGEELMKASVYAADVAIVDYSYPGSTMNGVDVIRYLRGQGVTEIHLSTSFADNEELQRAARAAGAASVIGKELG